MAKKQNQPAPALRFVRSANLELDYQNPHALNGYLLTSGARRVLGRLVSSIIDPAASRAWTVTGPYGTGKSSFTVFASQLFAPKAAAGNALARNILKAGDEDLASTIPAYSKQYGGLVSVAVTGSREPLQAAILRGLKKSLVGLEDALAQPLLRRVNKLQGHSENETGIADRDLLDIVSATAGIVSKTSGSGLLIIIDELGKLLEFAAAHPSKSDVYLLQHLAELAARSSAPILILTVLHKDFSGYADRLSAHERAEWEKVRGRYEDVVFEESADEVLRLVAMARKTISQGDDEKSIKGISPKDARAFEDLMGQAWRLQLAPAGMTKPEFFEVLRQCWPIHPLVAVLLGPVFRKLAQNERSVFSFLSSHEPFGLLDSLGSGHETSAVYGLDRLYDYLWNSLGEGLYSQRNGKRWAEVEGSLDRLVNATPAAISVLKIIGVISAIGGTKNIQATPDVVKFGSSGTMKPGDVLTAIKALQFESVITSRKYNNTLSLWEGSDVDIDERVKAARDQGEVGSTLTALATRYITVEPIVVRRHSFETGTLRFFTVRFVEPTSSAAEAVEISEGDGSILVVLASNTEERALIQTLVKSDAVSKRRSVLVAVPGESRNIDFIVRELACMEWVRENTPQLAGDLTARKELRARVAELQRQVQVLASNMLMPPEGQAPCEWFHLGKLISLGSRRNLNEHLSEICSKVYSNTPTILNELLNRRELSSQGAAARRILIEKMISSSDRQELGIDGYPPEKSMYLSLLLKYGIHRKGQDGWEFGEPNSSDAGVSEAWKAIQSFFDSTEKETRTIESLFAELRAAPFGLRAGVLPVLLCSALIANEADVALYEEGTFVAELAATVFERLIKKPSAYSVRRWRIGGVRATVFRQLAEMLGKQWETTKITKRNVLDVVRPLLRFFQQLPEYTKSTEQITEQARRVRAGLLQAREADQLLFADLPRACGMDPVEPTTHPSEARSHAFVSELRKSLGELQRHYEIALIDVGHALGSAFGISGTLSLIRERLTDRANGLRDWVADPSLKNFVTRTINDVIDDKTWIESVAGLLCERPPDVWRDSDRAKFDVAVTRTARTFRNLESLAIETNGNANGQTQAVRIGVTTKEGGDVERVIHIGPEDKSKLKEMAGRLQDAFDSAGIGSRKELILAALAEMAKRMLS